MHSTLRRVSLAALALAPAFTQAQAPGALQGDVRIRWDALTINPDNSSALANRVSSVVDAPQTSRAGPQATLRYNQGPVHADLELQALSDSDGQVETHAQLNELTLSGPLGPLVFTGGRRTLEWDVGFGFRPNDIVQQDTRRELLTTKAQGRGLLQLELFGTDASATLVWVNPHNLNAPADDARGARESALAAMGYLRQGPVDVYAFARYGERTGMGLGLSGVAVVSDSISVHASMRATARHDGWAYGGAPGSALVGSSPWQLATLGAARQALVGATWTGPSQQSLLFETWYDGTTLSDAQWREWQTRTDGLSVQARNAVQAGPGTLPGGLADGLAGNLGWQALPLSVLNQRRRTHLLRWSWQPEAWLLALDAQYNPADDGRIITASVQWQGEGLRVNAALRWFGGPPDAVSAQLPTTRTGLLAATWTY